MFAALMLLAFGASRHPIVEWKSGEIWLIREGGSPVQLTHDGCDKGEPASSPDGTRTAYFVNTTSDKPRCPTEVVLLGRDGTRLRTVPALNRGNAVMHIEWLGNDRIGIDTHINPSVGEYRVVSASTGKELAAYFGYGFQPSPDFKHIAHAGSVPHFSPPFARSDYLVIDNRIAYPTHLGEQPATRPPDPADKVLFRDIHEFKTDFLWSPDGKLIAFVEKLYDWRADAPGSYDGKAEHNRWQLVVVPATVGTPVQKKLPDGAAGTVKVQWNAAGHVKVAGENFSEEYSIAR